VWLTEMGYDPAAGEQVRLDVKYASRHLRLRPGALGGKKLAPIGTEPPGRPPWPCSPRNTTAGS
jgi:hypothetical protein